MRGAFPPVDLRAVCFVRAILRFSSLLCFGYVFATVRAPSTTQGRRRQLGHAHRRYVVILVAAFILGCCCCVHEVPPHLRLFTM